MREIKFRVFIDFGLEKKKNYMLYGPVDFNKKVIIDEGIGVAYPLKDKEIQQFTGLTDKNGKEIYEGDIVIWDDSEGQRKAIVEWVEGKIQYRCLVPEGRIFHQGKSFMYEKTKQYLEVIGNIHENKELIKED